MIEFSANLERDRPFFFIQIADPQVGCDPTELVGRRETDLLAQAVQLVNSLRPAFVILSGDMINMPSEADTIAPDAEPQAEEFYRLTADLDTSIPLYLLPGNHDVLDAPTGETLAWYRQRFGQDRYTFTCGGCLFVVVNSCVLYDARHCPQEADEQLQWLERTLADSASAGYAHTIVFLHHSLYVETREDKDGYFVLPKPMRLRLLELFHAHGVRAVFSGHYHRNARTVEDGLELVTTSALALALGDDPPGFRIVKVFDDRLEHEYCTLDEVPSAVDL